MKDKNLTNWLKTDAFKSLAVFLFIALFVFLGIRQLQPPEAAPASAPPTEFSYGRAIKHIEAIAQKPHPAGSLEHIRVREYILAEFTALGLDPQVQEATPVIVSHRRDMVPVSADIQNIVVRLEGTDNTRAVLIAGRYDSLVTSPEAAGSGASVAIALEVARALQAGPPLKNDVIFLLISDYRSGVGARGFLDLHPWAQDIGLVLHFTARGMSGPSVMFETSPQNGWLIEQFAQSAPRPVVASSLAYSVYQLLSGGTDFVRYKEAGWPGFNLAYLNDAAYYYTVLNTAEKLDEHSLQHQGSQALALIRHFGGLDLENIKKDNAVYFDIWGLTLFHYPEAWSTTLILVAALLYIGVIVIGLKRGRLTASGIGLGTLVLLLTILVVFVMIFLLQRAIVALHDEYLMMHYGNLYNGRFYLMSFVFLTIALTSTLYTLFHRKIKLQNLVAGGLSVWLILTLATGFYLPGASYLFLWPLLFSLLAFGVTFISKSQDSALLSWPQLIVLALCAIPGLVLFIPTIYLVHTAMPPLVLVEEWQVISWLATGGLAVAVLVVLLLGTLIPHLILITKPNKRLLPVAAALIGAGFLVAGSLTAGFNVERPRPNSILYSLDADTGLALWMTMEPQLDEWTSQFFPDEATQSQPEGWEGFVGRTFLGPAPVAPVPVPDAVLLDDQVSNGIRKLHFRVTMPQPARLARVNVFTESGTILNVKLNGRDASVDPSSEDQGLSFIQWGYSPSPEKGIEPYLETTSSQPIKVVVFVAFDGLPQTPDISFSPRPAYMIPSPMVFEAENVTIVRKSFEFSAP